MKQHIVRFLCAGCLCVAVSLSSAFAQSSQMITVDLPFAFQVNNHEFPAGKYEVKADAGQAAVLLRSADCKRAIFSLSAPVESANTHALPSLVFHRYDDRYFLSQIWMPGTNSGRGLTVTTAEREIARRLAQSAPKSAPKPGTEIVAVLGQLEGRSR
jgi:hypothetical protein